MAILPHNPYMHKTRLLPFQYFFVHLFGLVEQVGRVSLRGTFFLLSAW